MIKIQEYYKTKVVPVKCNKEDLNYLFQCNRLSAKVWNMCVRLDKEHQRNNKQQHINQTLLQKATKGCVPLHSKCIQHTVHKYLYARDAMWASIKAKHQDSYKVKLPYRNKKYFTTGWDYQAIKIDYQKGIIGLGKARTIIDGKPKVLKPIRCYVKNIPENVVDIQLKWKGKLCLIIIYKERAEYRQVESNNSAAIDLGEIHAITSIDNNNNALIITGRLMRSHKRFRNKEQAKLRLRMSKCTKYSRQWNKYNKAMQKLIAKSDRKELDSLHKITKHYVDYCVMRDISTVYYGDLDSLTRDGKKENRGHTFTRQKINQWSYGKLTAMLEIKLARYGIKMVKVKEYYTSQKCPNCKSLHKTRDRNYYCNDCGYTQHRDIVGAINILNDNDDRNVQYYSSKKYLQIG